MIDQSVPRTCWVVSDGRRGMENQCLGLAEGLAQLRPLDITVKQVSLSLPRRWLPYKALARFGGRFTPESGLTPPWPDLLIACGRAGLAASLLVKRESQGRCYTVQTQAPQVSPSRFDMVIPPRHDGLSGPNVFPILGAPHRITQKSLREAGPRFEPLFDHLPNPRVAVLIGGHSKAYRFDLKEADRLCTALEKLAAGGAGLMVTTSRRTGVRQSALIHERLTAAGAYVWAGVGENPYVGILALADAVLVTCDSTNMITEAAAAGRPVHVWPLAGGSDKFNRFHEDLERHGATRPFRGTLEHWTYEPLNETARAAQILHERLNALRVWRSITSAGAAAEPALDRFPTRTT